MSSTLRQHCGHTAATPRGWPRAQPPLKITHRTHKEIGTKEGAYMATLLKQTRVMIDHQILAHIQMRKMAKILETTLTPITAQGRSG